MERCLKSRRLRSWLQSELGLRGLGSVLLVALLAGCSSSSSPSAPGSSGGNASDVTGGSTNGTGEQTTAGGATSLAGATATGGSNGSGGVMTETGGSLAISSGGLTAGGTTALGTTSTGGVLFTGGSASGGLASAGGTTSAGGTVSTGGTIRTGGMSSTGGTASTAGVTGAGGNSATGGSSPTGGVTGTGGTTYDTSAVATTCPEAVPTGITSSFCNCVNEGPGYKTANGFTVANNVWGKGPGPECVWATTTTLWGVTAEHPQTSGVKSYPNIGISPKLLISGIKTYTSSFDITVPGNVGSWEAAYDIWLRTPGGGNTRIELMIWMYTYKTGPISSIVASTKPTIGDYTWTVHYGSNGSNATISLVNTSPSTGTTANVTSGTVDVKGILDWLIANNTTQYGQFDNTWTLDQVQWGFEISGDGGATQAFINNSFSVSSS